MQNSPRRVSILGDSISTFDGCNPDGFRVYYTGERREETGVRLPADTWWSQVIERLDGQLLANGSFSGSLVEGAGFPAGSSQPRIDALASDGVQPDVVIVFMGINDYGWGRARRRRQPAAATPCPSSSTLTPSNRAPRPSP
uniref:SGNH/GDSL hydrolase family protein n=1 Tax=Eggerthella sinensis TaxID=242230 RepID=UPI002FD83630